MTARIRALYEASPDITVTPTVCADYFAAACNACRSEPTLIDAIERLSDVIGCRPSRRRRGYGMALA